MRLKMDWYYCDPNAGTLGLYEDPDFYIPIEVGQEPIITDEPVTVGEEAEEYEGVSPRRILVESS